MNTKQAKDLILDSARSVFPNILPSVLQEARQALLAHLGMTLDDFGYYPSGGAKFDNLCSQVVKDLKSTGEMTTHGWEWRWVAQDEQELDLLNLETFLDEFVEEDTFSLYDLTDEDTLIRVVATTPCYGKVVKSDTMCQECPLFTLCCEAKGVASIARQSVKEAKAEALEIAKREGYDLKNIKIPKYARIHEANMIECKSETSCIVSGEKIDIDEVAVHIPGWGMVKAPIARAYQAMLSNP